MTRAPTPAPDTLISRRVKHPGSTRSAQGASSETQHSLPFLKFTTDPATPENEE
jgi:hypothetical protein